MTLSPPISPEEIESIAEALEGGSRIDRSLPSNGRIHIDRPQPFVCLHRIAHGNTDPGTRSLLGGLASYIVAPGEQSALKYLKALVTKSLGVLSNAFGAVALLEVSSMSNRHLDGNATDAGTVPALKLTAPLHGAPVEVLETFEMAVAAAEWPVARPEIDVQYASAPHPPQMPTLITEVEAKELNATLLCLEISPFFRDPKTLDLYPGLLYELRAVLGRILKQVLYSFCLTTATYRPVHYHELGPQAITEAMWTVDKGLSRISDAFDLLLYVTPVNTDEAYHQFRQSNFERKPEFHYRPLRIDPGALKRDLFSVPLEDVDDPALHQLFLEKREELDKQLSLLSERGTERFRYGSLQIFGKVDDDLLALARELLTKIPDQSDDEGDTDTIDAAGFARLAEAELGFYRQTAPQLDAQVFVREDVPGLLVSDGNLWIGAHTRVARSRVDAALHHEIGTHIVTHHNGKQQPFQQLHSGLAQYEELQEGLAVFSEFLVGKLSRPRLRHLAGRVVAAHSVAEGADFVVTYRILHGEHGFSQTVAYSTAMRVHRGGGYVKDAVYLRGLVRLLDYLRNDGTVDTLLFGKIGFRQISVMEELLWRRILSTDIVRPRYLDEPEAQRRLANVCDGISVVDMLDEASP